MRKKIVWLVVSCLMMLSLVLLSCAPAAPPEEEKPAGPVMQWPGEEQPATPPVEEKPAPPVEEKAEGKTVTLTKLNGEVVEKWVEKPKYGGIMTVAHEVPPLQFDEAYGHPMYAPTLTLTSDDLAIFDWTRGPVGTSESDFTIAYYDFSPMLWPNVAESWEFLPDEDTFIGHFKHGIHFANKPPANGREVTAEDWMYCANRMWDTPTSYQYANYPRAKTIISFSCPDKWTFVAKCAKGKLFDVSRMLLVGMPIPPHEVFDVYGKDALMNWRNVCGTGPFILTDYVSGSSATLVRNPNYWRTDPFWPENQLPYLDGVKMLFIIDLPTRMAAIRTHKVDWINKVTRDDAKSLMNTNPELQYKTFFLQDIPALVYKCSDPALPWYDVRVRQALNMAIDNKLIADTMYGGYADILALPVANLPVFWDIYTPLDKQPDVIKKQYEYHPDEAKQMLADAGYPNGFPAHVITQAKDVDLVSIVKDEWAKVGVDLTIEVKDYGAYISQMMNKTYAEMVMYQVSNITWYAFSSWRAISQLAPHGFSNPYYDGLMDKIVANMFNPTESHRLEREEFGPYLLEQALVFQFPSPYVWNFWNPRIHNYFGAWLPQYVKEFGYCKYVWIGE